MAQQKKLARRWRADGKDSTLTLYFEGCTPWSTTLNAHSYGRFETFNRPLGLGVELIAEMESEHKLVSDLTPDLVIEVTSRVEAGDILGSPERCAEVTCLISIGAFNDELPIGYHNISSKVRLLFGDTLDAESGATEGDVRTLMEIAQNLRSFKGKVLIHCEAGVSRSTAAALILYACWLGAGREDEAMRRVLPQRPLAIPNRRMIELADHLLNRRGRLLEALG